MQFDREGKINKMATINLFFERQPLYLAGGAAKQKIN